MYRFMILIAGMLMITSCFNSDSGDAELYQSNDDEAISDESFIHIVLFDLADSLSQTEMDNFLNSLDGLREIEELDSFFAGPHLDIGDARALSQYDICMQMRFKTREDYNIYQNHPVHKALKKNVGPLLKSSPKTYDFRIN